MAPGKFVVFELSGERFGLPIESVERILEAEPVTRIPKSPAAFLGVFNLRGSTLPVLDTRALLGMERADAKSYVVALHDNQRFAITVDSVDSIMEFTAEQIEEENRLEFLSQDAAIGKSGDQIIILLSVGGLLPEKLRRVAIQQVKAA